MSETQSPEVEQANGSFYDHYKNGTLEFMQFVRKIGEDRVASGKLLPADLEAVRHGLHTLDRQGGETFPLLSKVIDEQKPGFWDECIVENIWSLMGAVFMIAQHSGITRSAEAHLHSSRTALMREVKAPRDADRIEKQRQALKSVLGKRNLAHPDSVAAWIFRDAEQLSKLQLACQELKIKKFSEVTARRRIREIASQP